VLASTLLHAAAAPAAPLEKQIPQLFGGVFATSITPRGGIDAQRPSVAARFRKLSAALAAARSQAPFPSAGGAFTFAWDDELETYLRSQQSLGPGVAERAQTLGRRAVAFSVAYTRLDFDSMEGDSLDHLRTRQPALTDDFLAQLPEGDRARAEDNVLETTLNLDFGFDLVYLTAAYGITDSIDVSLALSVNRAHMRARAEAVITDPDGDEGAFFQVTQHGVVIGGDGPICSTDFRCAEDGFDDSAFGTGDIYLRGKWHAYDFTFADLAVAGVLTLPTGNADDLLGFHDPTFTPWLIASKTWGRVSPHVNLGYAIRSDDDVSQAAWIAGAEVRAFDWLTLTGDFLGYHDDERDGINDDVLQSAIGGKVELFGAVISASFQFPLNDDGLRADVIYTGQVEYTFRGP
jgi:hypothetical protein